MADTVATCGPVATKIYKKTATGTAVLYYPETNAAQVKIGGTTVEANLSDINTNLTALKAAAIVNVIATGAGLNTQTCTGAVQVHVENTSTIPTTSATTTYGITTCLETSATSDELIPTAKAIAAYAGNANSLKIAVCAAKPIYFAGTDKTADGTLLPVYGTANTAAYVQDGLLYSNGNQVADSISNSGTGFVSAVSKGTTSGAILFTHSNDGGSLINIQGARVVTPCVLGSGANLNSALTCISTCITNLTQAFLYKGPFTPTATVNTSATLPDAATMKAGYVYSVTTNFAIENGAIYEDTSINPQHLAGENIIVFDPATDNDSTTTGTALLYDSFGGSLSAYALKGQAIGEITADGGGLHTKKVDGTAAGVSGTSTISATTAATTYTISTCLDTSATSDTQIPTAKAVADYTGKADSIVVTSPLSSTAATLPLIENSGASTKIYRSSISVCDTTKTITGNLAGNATCATTAQQVACSITICVTTPLTGTNVAYNGSSGKSITVGHKASGISAGTYSALAVDTYGHATAGGQSLAFLNSLTDLEWDSLVVGGLAFVSTSENPAIATNAAKTSGSPAAIGNVNA